MSSGPATAALSYALLIACALMPLLLPVSYFAVKLHGKRPFIQTSDTEEDGVEFEIRNAFKESRGKSALRENIDAIPCRRRASKAVDELSKARIVQVVAYFRRASGMRGRARYSLACVYACTCWDASAERACRGQERRARAIRGCSQVFAFAGDCRRPERPRRGGASCQTAGQVARSMSLVTAMCPHDVVCCMPATKLISRRC
jgi:hypothetical protein